MLPLYEVQKVSDEYFILKVEATESTGVFEGHFDGHPILPGVVQLDWVMKFAQNIFSIEEPTAQDFQIKFSHIIQPGQIELHLRYVKARIEFVYHANTTKCSSGSIKLMGNI